MNGLREFDNAKDLMEFYRQLRNRRTSSWIQPRRPAPPPPPVAAPPPPPPEPEPEPEPEPPPPEPEPVPPRRTMHPFRAQTLQRIILAAASELDIPAELARSHARTRPAVLLRHVVMLLTRQVAGWSYPEIGRALGGRDHTTVMHGVSAIRRRMTTDPALAHKIGNLLEQLVEGEGKP
jgi:hypothetical protein